MLRTPVPDLAVDEDTRVEAWEAAEERLAQVALIVGGTAVTAALQLEEAGQEYAALQGVLCVLLAAEQQIAEDEIGSHETDPVWLQGRPALFYREVAAQKVLLAVEYIDVIITHLADPDVDWLRE